MNNIASRILVWPLAWALGAAAADTTVDCYIDVDECLCFNFTDIIYIYTYCIYIYIYIYTSIYTSIYTHIHIYIYIYIYIYM